MKKLSLLLLFTISISITSHAQSTKYFRHLRYNHVSPYVELVGILPIDEAIAKNTSHYIFKLDESGRVSEIINNHYHTEKVHPLASLGVYKVVIEYDEGKEIRTFYDPNGKRIVNDRKVYKEVFLINKNGTKKQLNFYDLADGPMESNWKIAKYQWEKTKKYIVERRYNLNEELVDVSPYFEFGITGIQLDKNGAPKGHFNLNEKLEVIDNSFGVASYQDTYDKEERHTKYTYHNKENDLVINQWGYSVGKKIYDSIGNNIELKLEGANGQTLSRKVYSNASIKMSQVASQKDSLEIKSKALGYLVALQQLKPELMDAILNDNLNKITVGYDRNTKMQFGKATTKEQMIQFAEDWNKSGTQFPFNPKNQVKILDIYDQIATVRLISDNWVEYLQLIKLNGNWEIMNLIWQHKDVSRYGQ